MLGFIHPLRPLTLPRLITSLRRAGVALGLLTLFAGCIAPASRPPRPDAARVAVERQLQDQIAATTALADLRRLQRVAFPLLQATTTLPGVPTRPSLGLFVGHVGLFRKDQEAAQQIGLTADWTVLEVFPDSPAAVAGLQVGDRLRSINGHPLPPPDPKARRGTRSPILLHLVAGEVAQVGFERANQPLAVAITPVALADYSLELRASLEINALATGRGIRVNRGCLQSLDDADLSFILAHEMAHNALRHQRAVLLNYLTGTLVDAAALGVGVYTGNAVGAASALVHSQGFEREADALGLLIQHRAGQPIAEAPTIWRRLAAIYPGLRKRSWLPTHPVTPERVVSMEDTVQQILATPR